ncbi:MAG: hypothetical protein PVJ80_05940 [Gemmatimonadota bacterium]|jgi:hypothetical protein
MHRFVALAILALTACDAGGGADQVPGRTVALLDYQATVPASMQEHPSTNSMRLAQYVVSRDDGTEAEVIVYYFGQGQGGSAEANIVRWSHQFTGPDGDPVTPHVMDVEGTAFPTTLAEFEGTYRRGIGMGDEAEPEPGQALVAAVVETPRGNLFLQLFGDRAAVAATRDDFLSMVTSIRPTGGSV